MSRLTVELTGEQHQQIKAMAAMQGKSIKEYVLERLFPVEVNQDEQQAWDALKSLLSERVAAAKRGEISNKTFEQITEETLQELGKV
ncbi:MAG: antitoxin [Symploca sp. SIO2G7]|nr:antitoxin [Symploca sp. SIO2G7]